MVRIETHLTEEEAKKLSEIAKKNGRSRKAQTEYYLRKMIQDNDNHNN
jgi:hypothetical protein